MYVILKSVSDRLFMKHSTLAASIAALLILSFVVPFFPAEAATRRSSWSDYWRDRSEGGVSTTTLEEVSSRRGVSSATRKAIDALDDDAVEDLPIPVLLGVAKSDLFPNFGDPRDGGARTHQGEDILAPKDDYIVSPTEAVVIKIGSGGSSGNYVYTANPGDETFAYMHLDKFAEGLKVGQVLEVGDLIGYVGNTGNAAGGPTHLHFEIREGKTATDPYPRLARTFTLEERVDAVTKALEESPEDAALLAKDYRALFLSAKAAGMKLPEEIASELGSSSTGFTRDLDVGAKGDDVLALQLFLMGKDTGPKATALAATGATGYFGALTKAALAEYQASVGISPAVGYFGPLTRAKIASAAVAKN